MKVLLDENIDVRFKSSFSEDFTVFTIRDMNWNGIKNGDLIRLISENNFDVWVVVDKNIPYQQNVAALSFLIIVVDVFRNTLKNLLPFLPELESRLRRPMKPGVICSA